MSTVKTIHSTDTVYIANSDDLETYYGYIGTTDDAYRLFEACRLGVRPRLKRRLFRTERRFIRPGSVYVWEETEADMCRWVDGKSWSRCNRSGSFYKYHELQRKGGRRKPDGLIKGTFIVTTSTHQKLHLISYYTQSQLESGGLVQPTADENLKNIHPPKGMYSDATSEEYAAVVGQQGVRAVPYQHSAPANCYNPQLHNHPRPHQHQSEYLPPNSLLVPKSHPYEYYGVGPHSEKRPSYSYHSPVTASATNYSSHGAVPPHEPHTVVLIHCSSMLTSPGRSSTHITPPPLSHSTHRSPSMTHHHSPNCQYYGGPDSLDSSQPRFHRNQIYRPSSAENHYSNPNDVVNGYRPNRSGWIQDSAIQTCMRLDDNKMKDSFRVVL